MTDLTTVATAQLGRPPRGLRGAAHTCSCGLPDGEPFPTFYWLSCPRASSAIGRLEGSGLMREMSRRLHADPDLAAAYRAAHDDYLRRRDAVEPLGIGVSAGGMPDRVKCLHVLAAHALAAGRGVNPLGDEVLDLLPDWGARGPCVEVS